MAFKNILFRVKQQTNVRYSSTAKVWIDKNTTLICQGFTGKQGNWTKIMCTCLFS